MVIELVVCKTYTADLRNTLVFHIQMILKHKGQCSSNVLKHFGVVLRHETL